MLPVEQQNGVHMADIYIISGFLGAGKTTLIKTMVRSVFKDKKVIVIENDFGEAGIDAGLLKECDLKVTSLNAGCICCSLTGDFERAVDRILEDFSPDAILVEPSGVSRLSDIIKICLKKEDEEKAYLRKTITVVDTRSFDKYQKNYGEIFMNQIVYADLILFSHQKECLDKLRHTEDEIREINPEARIETGFWDSLSSAVFHYGPQNSSIFKLEMKEAMSMKPVKLRGRARKNDSQRFDFIRRFFAKDVLSAVTLEWTTPLSEDQLRKKVLYVVEHAKGEILRGKGIVASGSQGLVFHFVSGGLNIEPVNAAGNQVCFIGAGLDAQQIKTLFSEGK